MGVLTLALLVVWLPAALANNPLQMEVELKNAYKDGSNYYFDLYLRQVGPAPILLVFSDLAFDVQPAQANMQLQMVPGSSNLRSAAGYAVSYEAGIQAQVLDRSGLIIAMINADAPNDINAQNYAYRVAQIDYKEGMHRLGRFFLANYAGALNDFGLDLRIHAGGSNRKVFALDPYNNLNAIPVELFYKKPEAFDQQLVRSIDVKFSDNKLAVASESAFESSLAGYKLHNLSTCRPGTLWMKQARTTTKRRSNNTSWWIPILQGVEVSTARLPCTTYRVVAMQQDGKVFESPAKRVLLNQEISFNSYPNPANSEVNVRLANYHSFDAFHLRIYDSAGWMVYNQVMDGAAQPIVDVNHLADGAYFVQVQNGRNQSVNRLIVMKGR